MNCHIYRERVWVAVESGWLGCGVWMAVHIYIYELPSRLHSHSDSTVDHEMIEKSGSHQNLPSRFLCLGVANMTDSYVGL